MQPLNLNPAELEALVSMLPSMTEYEQKTLLEELDALEDVKIRAKAASNFVFFARKAYEGILIGHHHRIIAKAFEKAVTVGGSRIIINMAPRHGKSIFASYLLPAWFLGRYPNKKIIQASHTGELAVDFGRKVRNLIDSERYQKLFPGVELSYDSKAAGRWSTNQGGEYFAAGVGANIAGKGADLFIIDDPHSEQDGKSGNSAIFDTAYDWYQTGPRQRLQPNASIVVVMTRWNKKDLTGRLVDNMMKNDGGDEWEVIQLPMELPSGEPVWPEFWKKEDIAKLKATLDVQYWNAQYQQNPTSEEGALIKREWWIEWEPENPPKCNYIILSVDTAHEKTNRADYSAFTVWGVFQFVDDEEKKKELKGKPVNNIILLNAFKERLEFPELKTRAYETWKEWKPDSFIVEKKASGAPLIQELRRMGIPVQEFIPSKGTDKIARVNSISDIFRSGMVWAPATRWAQNVIDECAEFPQGDHDDYTDSTSQALMRFRQGGFISLDTDWQDEVDQRYSLMKRAAYY